MYRLFSASRPYGTVQSVCESASLLMGSIANLLDCIHACCRRRRLVVVSLCKKLISQGDDVRRCLVIYALAVLFC